METPRFTRPQQGRASRDGEYEYNHLISPVAASSATTSLGAWVRYITPSTTSGVDSNFSRDRAWNAHCNWRLPTLPGVICVNGLYLWLSVEPEYVSQFCGSLSACKIRSKVTCACNAPTAKITSNTRANIVVRLLFPLMTVGIHQV